MRTLLAVLWIPVAVEICALAPTTSSDPSVPELTAENVSVSRADIRVWGVKSTSAVRQGSTTSSEQGTVNVAWGDGSTSSHDATYKVTSGTLFQDGEVCHNFGPKCYCATTTFRLESGAKLWKFGTPSGNEAVTCPSGIEPTGDAEIRKSEPPPDPGALREKVLREKASKGKGK